MCVCVCVCVCCHVHRARVRLNRLPSSHGRVVMHERADRVFLLRRSLLQRFELIQHDFLLPRPALRVVLSRTIPLLGLPGSEASEPRRLSGKSDQPQFDAHARARASGGTRARLVPLAST